MSSSLDAAWARFRAALLDAKVLADLGGPGLYARGPAFVRTYHQVDALAVRSMAKWEPEIWRFPTVESRDLFEKTDYLASFPQLAAGLSGFSGGDREHAELLNARAEGRPWESLLEPAGLMMTPAVCHPLYAAFAGQVFPTGRVYDVLGDSFRHEPSLDPMRMQTFHQHDFVYIGTADDTLAHRDAWGEQMKTVFAALELDVDYVPANDPFFGRAGRMLAKNQLTESLKYEFVLKIYGEEHEPTAISSANFHGTHFGESFELRDGAGNVANTACIGFGLERIVLSLFAIHGIDPDGWPAGVTAALQGSA